MNASVKLFFVSVTCKVFDGNCKVVILEIPPFAQKPGVLKLKTNNAENMDRDFCATVIFVWSKS